MTGIESALLRRAQWAMTRMRDQARLRPGSIEELRHVRSADVEKPTRGALERQPQPGSPLLPLGRRLLDLADLSHRILGRLPGALGVIRPGIVKSSGDFLARGHRGMTHPSLERSRSDRG